MRKVIVMYLKRKLRSEETNAINDLFSSAYRFVKFLKYEPLIIEYLDDPEYKVEDIVEGIMTELVIDIHSFLSNEIEVVPDYLDFILPLLSNIEFSNNEFFLKEADVLVKNIRLDIKESIKKQVLKNITDLELLSMAKVFLECNMNTSLTANKLYMHRNTLINKLDRFKELTGYDLRQFTEAFIIFSLL